MPAKKKQDSLAKTKNTTTYKKGGSVKKVPFLGKLNPFRVKKKTTDEKGNVTTDTYSRWSDKKIKSKTVSPKGKVTKTKYKGKSGVSKIKTTDAEGKTTKKKFWKKTGESKKVKTSGKPGTAAGDVKKVSKYRKDGTLRKVKKTSYGDKAYKVKFKKDDKTGGNIVRKAKGVKVDTDATGQITGDLTYAKGYKYKVKKRPKKGGTQIKEKGVPMTTPWGKETTGVRKRIVDDSGNVIKEKTRKRGIKKSSGWKDKTGSGEKAPIKGYFGRSTVKPEDKKETPINKKETPTDNKGTDNKGDDKNIDTSVTKYGSKRAEYADKNIKSAKFVEKDGTKNLRSYGDVWKSDKATREKYGNDYSKFTKAAEDYWKSKNLSRGGSVGKAKYGGARGPQGVL